MCARPAKRVQGPGGLPYHGFAWLGPSWLVCAAAHMCSAVKRYLATLAMMLVDIRWQEALLDWRLACQPAFALIPLKVCFEFVRANPLIL